MCVGSLVLRRPRKPGSRADRIVKSPEPSRREPAHGVNRSARARPTAARASAAITIVRDASRPADAVVVEDDTHLILSAKAEARETHGNPRSFVRQLDDTFPKKPGSVIIASAGGRTQFHAVIHDLDLDPTWRDAWISEALHKILREAHERDIRSVLMPVLGPRDCSRPGARRGWIRSRRCEPIEVIRQEVLDVQGIEQRAVDLDRW